MVLVLEKKAWTTDGYATGKRPLMRMIGRETR
jgi:hypothetical protein